MLQAPRSPENFLWGALLDLLIGDYSRLEILLGLHIVVGRYGVGLSGSFKLSIPIQSRVLASPRVWVTRFFRPVHAQQAQREA